MADYEFLEQGGHARLVSDTKGYVDRAGGVGTSQLADESVTMDKLADDVDDELDAIASDGAEYAGNVLKGELAEGSVLTADDAYAAPPKGVDVYGVSTQDGTPTPDAPVEINSVDDLTLMIRGKNLLGLTDVAETTQNGVTYSVSNSVINISGTPTTGFDLLLLPMGVKERYHFTAGEKISFSFDNTPSNVSVVIMHQAGGGMSAVPYNNATINPVWLYVGAIRLRFTSGSAVNASFSIQMEQGTAATTFEPYIGQSISIPLGNNAGRSLPDGTRDELTLSYIGPSTEHEGWGVFSANLTKVLDTLELDDYSWIYSSNYDYFSATLGDSFAILENGNSDPLCDVYASYGVSTINNIRNNLPDMSLAIRALYRQIFIRDSGADGDVTTFTSRISGGKLLHKLTTPQTHDLGTVELPILPNPLTAWADGGSAQPTLAMEYERDKTIVINALEAALADLATS